MRGTTIAGVSLITATSWSPRPLRLPASIEAAAQSLGFADLRVEYDWLCSVAHPSFGEAFDDDESVDATIRSYIDQACTTSLEIFIDVFQRATHLVDDIALTTNAPRLARFSYWRQLRPTERNDLCPCRSGQKTKSCDHSWGSPYVS